MSSGTRTWVRPELVVLVRGRHEERVLSACKLETPEHDTPGSEHLGCLGLLPFPCAICSLVMSS